MFCDLKTRIIKNRERVLSPWRRTRGESVCEPWKHITILVPAAVVEETVHWNGRGRDMRPCGSPGPGGGAGSWKSGSPLCKSLPQVAVGEVLRLPPARCPPLQVQVKGQLLLPCASPSPCCCPSSDCPGNNGIWGVDSLSQQVHQSPEPSAERAVTLSVIRGCSETGSRRGIPLSLTVTGKVGERLIYLEEPL